MSSEKIKPRWYQAEAIQAFFDAVKQYPNQDLLEVLPTGAGKSLTMAHILARVSKFGNAVVLARSKELVCQNQAAFCECFPELADQSGAYCAGLGLREFDKPILFASIQSAFNKGELIGPRKLVVIDEAHQVPANENTQYQTFLAEMRRQDPKCKLLGMTASPYRLDGGVIFGKGQQFDRVCYNVPLGVLFDEGYVTRPETLATTEIDLSNVRRTAGDFNKADVESQFLGNSITKEVVAAANAKDAKSVLIFASGVAHAQVLKGELEAAGESVMVVTGDTPPLFRESAIESFANRRTRFLVNVECFTTGFNVKCIDMIVVARATESPGLFLQMVGRGFRLYKDKTVCWIMDYGGNIDRFGPIDSSGYGMDSIKPPSQGEGEPPRRVCPSCFEINHAGARRCIKCGMEFPQKPKIFKATSESIIEKAVKRKVKSVSYQRWRGKDGKPDTLMAEYEIEPDDKGGKFDAPVTRRVREWICLEHEGYAGKKAREWWQSASLQEFPSSIDEALEIINVIGLADPYEITVKKDGKYDKVTYRRYGDAPEKQHLGFVDLYDEEDLPF